jgi:nucleobase transporter 1/2
MPIQKFKRIMRAIQGALIVASTLQIVLGFSGLWRNVTRLVWNLN